MTSRFILASILLMSGCLMHAKFLYAWNDTNTHPDITRYVIKNTINLKLENYLKNRLGFKDNIEEAFYEKYSNGKPKGNPIRFTELIAKGAEYEDKAARGYNHFHQPNGDGGLYEKVEVPLITWTFKGNSNREWAKGDCAKNCLKNCDCQPVEDDPDDESNDCNDYSWIKARDAFRMALTGKTNEDRDKMFIRSFRSVGQVVHLLQDMAVPAHTRNDFKGHMHFRKLLKWKIGWWSIVPYYPDPKTVFGNNIECYVAGDLDNDMNKIKELGDTNSSAITIPTFSKLGDFWDTDKYNMDIQQSFNNGLAEYSSANFLSTNKMLGNFYHPNIDDTDNGTVTWVNPEAVVSEDGKTDYVIYYRNIVDNPPHRLMSATRAAIHECIEKRGFEYCSKYASLDIKCHEDYSKKLIPKAIGYSAGVMNYFFRGTLEISMPDRYLYSIADGSKLKNIGGVEQEYFDYIKAKVKNTTIDTLPTETTPPGGKLWAIAKYKKIKHYKPALASDVPLETDRESDFSYSVSAVFTPEEGDVPAIDTETEFEFDFSDNPIPAGITDLTLQVVYQGKLGQEDGAVAVSPWKNLSEPTHFSFFNGTDQVYFWQGKDSAGVDYGNIFRTAQEMEQQYHPNDVVKWPSQPPYAAPHYHWGGGYVDDSCMPYKKSDETLAFIGCNSRTLCVYPYAQKVQISFYPLEAAQRQTAHVTYASLPAGRYGRMILLCDGNATKISAKLDIVPANLNDDPWQQSNPDTMCKRCGYTDARYKRSFLLAGNITLAKNKVDANGVFVQGEVLDSFRDMLQHSSGFNSNWTFYFKNRVLPDPVGQWYKDLKSAPWPAMDNTSIVEFDTGRFNP